MNRKKLLKSSKKPLSNRRKLLRSYEKPLRNHKELLRSSNELTTKRNITVTITENLYSDSQQPPSGALYNCVSNIVCQPGFLYFFSNGDRSQNTPQLKAARCTSNCRGKQLWGWWISRRGPIIRCQNRRVFSTRRITAGVTLRRRRALDSRSWLVGVGLRSSAWLSGKFVQL